jgi:hypothetical protein
VSGSTKRTTKGKMTDKGKDAMLITGRFKDARNPDFRMTLTSNVSNADFQQGYCVTGTLDRGDKRKNEYQLTHYAMVRRKGYEVIRKSGLRASLNLPVINIASFPLSVIFPFVVLFVEPDTSTILHLLRLQKYVFKTQYVTSAG